MRLKITTWDSHNINDLTNYEAVIQPGNAMPSAVAEFVNVGQTNPVLANKTVDGGYFTINIIPRGNLESQRDELNKWFQTDDFTFRNLMAQDLDNSNKEWYLECYPVTPPLLADASVAKYSVTFALRQPYWRSVIGGASTWSVTASGQTNVVTPIGSKSARPVFTITPTGAKTGGYAFAKFVPWYNPSISNANSEPLEVTNGGLNTAALVADNSNKCQVNNVGGITAVVTTIPYDTVTGSIPSSGLIYIDSEQISYTGKTGTTSGNLSGCVRGVNGTTAATHADNAVIYRSKIMANGNDLRVFMNNVEVERWVTGINTATTKIWINQQSQRQPYLFLNTTLGIGAVGSISVTNPQAWQGTKIVPSELNKLPSSFIFAIGTEVFTASGYDANALTITVSGRAKRNSTEASHAIGDRIYFIENDISIVYGNPSASAPTSNDTRKPMIDLTNSTNTSWVWTEFGETSGLRTAAWKAGGRSHVNAYLSGTYTAAHVTDASPFTEMGITLNAWRPPNWLSPYSIFTTNYLTWVFSHPAGVSAVTVTGSKYRYTSEWPVFQLTGASGVIFTETTPSAAQTWEALASHSAVAAGGGGLTFTISSGSLSAVANNSAAVEIAAVTATLTTANVMQFLTSLAENNTFYMDSTITNSTTGESISITLTMELNKVLIIDCDAETVVYNGVDIGCPIRWNTVRLGWLDLVVAANTLTFTDTGTIPGITVQIDWKDRATL